MNKHEKTTAVLATAVTEQETNIVDGETTTQQQSQHTLDMICLVVNECGMTRGMMKVGADSRCMY